MASADGIPRLIGPPPSPGGTESEFTPSERAELLMHITTALSLSRLDLFQLYSQEEMNEIEEGRKPPGLAFELFRREPSAGVDPPAVNNFDEFARLTVNALCSGIGATKTERKTALDAVVRFQPFAGLEESTLRNLDGPSKKHLLASCLLVLLLTKKYDARARVLLRNVSIALGYDKGVEEIERVVAMNLVSENMLLDQQKTQEYVNDAAKKNKLGRILSVGAATIGGGLLIGLTGGIAAPFIGAGLAAGLASVGLGGTALASGLTILAGNAALIGTIFGSYGASVSNEMVANRMRDVEDFEIKDLNQIEGTPVDDDDLRMIKRLHVTICVSGWLQQPEDAIEPWKVLGDTEGDRYALIWERQALLDVGEGLVNIVKSLGGRMVITQVLQQTALATLSMALWPLALLNASYLIDNPWQNGLSLAQKTGKVLAEVILARTQGERPVSLVGASLGAVVVFECLLELERRGGFGIVEDAVLLGAPVSSEKISWMRARRVVAGRLVNAYSANDWVLAFCYRTLNFKLGVAGLTPIEGVPGVENVDLTKEVTAHTAYRYPGLLLKQCGFDDLVQEEVQHQQADATEEAEAEQARRIAEIDLESSPADASYRDLQKPNPGEQLPPWMDPNHGASSGFDDGMWLAPPSVSPITPESGRSEVLFEVSDDTFGPETPVTEEPAAKEAESKKGETSKDEKKGKQAEGAASAEPQEAPAQTHEAEPSDEPPPPPYSEQPPSE